MRGDIFFHEQLMTTLAQSATVALVGSALAALAACGSDESTGPSSPLGTYRLVQVLGVPMPATVKDPLSQTWIRYSTGLLVLRGDSTYDMQIDSRFRDFPDVAIDGSRSGTFHWRRETGAIELLDPRTENGFRGTATADTIGLYCYPACSVPAPGQAWNLTFARPRR